MRFLRSATSSVVWVRSPVKTMKSGCCGSAFTAATACLSVLAASGLGGPEKPQWVSDSCTKKKSSFLPLLDEAPQARRPARPDANAAPPRPTSLKKSRRLLFGSNMVAPSAEDVFAGADLG